MMTEIAELVSDLKGVLVQRRCFEMKPTQVTGEEILGGSLVFGRERVEYRVWLKNALRLSSDDTI
jgi:hypothetical protein